MFATAGPPPGLEIRSIPSIRSRAGTDDVKRNRYRPDSGNRIPACHSMVAGSGVPGGIWPKVRTVIGDDGIDVLTTVTPRVRSSAAADTWYACLPPTEST